MTPGPGFRIVVAGTVGSVVGWWIGPILAIFAVIPLVGLYHSLASASLLRALFWLFLICGLLGFPSVSRLWRNGAPRSAHRAEPKFAGTPWGPPAEPTTEPPAGPGRGEDHLAGATLLLDLLAGSAACFTFLPDAPAPGRLEAVGAFLGRTFGSESVP